MCSIAGDVTMAGSILRQHALPARANALAVTRLLDAGAVIVGRTNLTEF
jgi:aspartyl-tRNA(Asn)/glutamyl-tRNA(Gln) amidotransferase subunit A